MNLREMIKEHEGLRVCPYLCPAGKMTIGYGWNLDNQLPPETSSYYHLHGKITEDMADSLLNISIDNATRQAMSLYPGFPRFTENRRNALIDFVFNVGAGTALKFKNMRAAIEREDWISAADHMVDSLWYRQVKGRARRIVEMIRNG